MPKPTLDVGGSKSRNRSNSSLAVKGRTRSRSELSPVDRVTRSRSNSYRSEANEIEAAKDVNAIFRSERTVLNGQPDLLLSGGSTAHEQPRHRDTVSGGHLTVNRQHTSPTITKHHNHSLLHVARLSSTEPAKHSKSHENSGFLSSILNVMTSPHANEGLVKSNSPPEEKKTSFITKLDSLIKNSFADDTGEPSQTQGTASVAGSAESVLLTKDSEETSSPLSASNIHFQPLRDTPINSLGNGDLTLDDFQDSRRDPVNAPESFKNPMDVDPLETLSLNDGRNKRRSTTDQSDDETDNSLDYDYSQIKFASDKRNKEFHQTFKKVPRHERLIDDFSCALSKDILIQGRMYLSEHYLCFKSNILGWVTNLLIPLQEVVQIEKKTTAGLFPNGMVIQTLYQNYSFATFTSRDTVFNLMTSVWHHVLLEKHDSGRHLTSSSDHDRMHGSDLDVSSEEIKGEPNSETTDESQDDDDQQSTNSADSADISSNSELLNDSVEGEENGDKSTNAHTENDLIPLDKQFKGISVIGPSAHAPTELGFTKDSNETLVVDETFNAPMGAIFSLLFGKDNTNYVKILEAQKNFDIQENDITELSNEKKSRNYKYTKPLSNPMGPKQATCLIEDKILELDFDKCIIVEQTTQTPDVPSGNAFKIHTKIVLSWGENNSTRFYVVTMVAWSGKSWVKGLVEKGSIDGQVESMKVLVDYINLLLSSSKGGDLKKKRPRKKSVTKKAKDGDAGAPVATTEEKPFGEKLNDLIEEIGGSLPVRLPISNLISGYLALIFGLSVFIMLYNWMLHGHTDYKVTFGYSPGSAIPVARYKDNQYFMFPTIESNFQDQNVRMKAEVSIWDWVQEKSGNKIKVSERSRRGTQAYGVQEIEEIMRLTKLRLAELGKQIGEE